MLELGENGHFIDSDSLKFLEQHCLVLREDWNSDERAGVGRPKRKLGPVKSETTSLYKYPLRVPHRVDGQGWLPIVLS